MDRRPGLWGVGLFEVIVTVLAAFNPGRGCVRFGCSR